MPENKIVVHYKDGTLLKGTTADFLPKKVVFHVMVGGMGGQDVQEIFVDDLKGLFFVKSLTGDKSYREMKGFPDRPVAGKKVKATFTDAEVICGYTHVIHYDQPGFLMVPADQKSNNERIFVVFSSLRELEVDGSPVDLRRVRRRG